jgi:hypothetical protein
MTKFSAFVIAALLAPGAVAQTAPAASPTMHDLHRMYLACEQHHQVRAVVTGPPARWQVHWTALPTYETDGPWHNCPAVKAAFEKADQALIAQRQAATAPQRAARAAQESALESAIGTFRAAGH